MSQPPAINEAQPHPQPHNPHAQAIQLAATEHRPKQGDEDYINRPENAFILFRREYCLKRNEAEGGAANEGEPIARRQRQADLSKTNLTVAAIVFGGGPQVSGRPREAAQEGA